MIGDSTEAMVTAEPQRGASTSRGSSTSANGNGNGQSYETIGAKRKREQADAEAKQLNNFNIIITASCRSSSCAIRHPSFSGIHLMGILIDKTDAASSNANHW